MPDARPPSSGLADWIAVPSDGMNASAMPAAAISDAGSTSTTNEPSGRTSERIAMPVASSSRPIPSAKNTATRPRKYGLG
jgi:hypothetical protein